MMMQTSKLGQRAAGGKLRPDAGHFCKGVRPELLERGDLVEVCRDIDEAAERRPDTAGEVGLLCHCFIAKWILSAQAIRSSP